MLGPEVLGGGAGCTVREGGDSTECPDDLEGCVRRGVDGVSDSHMCVVLSSLSLPL
jgi:hypothetical protein